MATLVLGALGSAIAGPFGGFVGATLGSYIDNQFILPALFPPDDIVGPRQEGLGISSGNEGTPMNWFLGPRNRLPGCIIWLGEREEVKRRHSPGKSGGKGGPPTGDVVTFEYYQSFAVGFGEASPQTVDLVRALIANTKRVYDDGPTTYYDSITIYNGAQTAPDPVMEAALGAGNVPIFKDHVYVVVERLALRDFGQSVPNLQSFAEQQVAISLRTVVEKVLERAEFTSDEYDATRLRLCVRGVNVSGVAPSIRVLQGLLTTYAAQMQDLDGKLVFHQRGDETPIEIPEGDLVSGIAFTDPDHDDLPDQATLTYVSEDVDLQPGSEPYRNQSAPVTHNNLRVNVPVVLTSDEAIAVAKRLYWSKVSERVPVEFSLPSRWYHLAGGDVVRIVRGDDELLIALADVTLGVDGRVRCRGRLTWPPAHTQTGVGTTSGYVATAGYVPPDLDWLAADAPGMTNQEVDQILVRWGARVRTPEAPFRSATLFASTDDTEFSAVGQVHAQMIDGDVLEAPGAGTTLMFDGANALRVRLRGGGFLASATDEEVLDGLVNIGMISCADNEWEVLGFVNVEQVDESEYVLTRLLRGLRGTEHLVGRAAGGKFVLLTGIGDHLALLDAGAAILGATPYLRVVAEGGLVSDVRSRRLPVRGRSMRPLSPFGLDWRLIVHDASTRDVALSWHRRSKLIFDPIASATPSSPDENPTRFRVEVRLNGPESALLRSVELDVPEYNYSQADRDEDEAANPYGWTAEDNFFVFVYQISNVVGDSPPAALRVTR